MPLGLGYALGFPLGWVYTLTGQVEITPDDALDLLIQLLPDNASKLYGLWQKSGDVYQFYAGIADSLKAFCYDYIALLRAETAPQTATFKLSDWEGALGIAGTRVTVAGTAAQRRLAIISKLREQGAFTVSNIRAILGPLLGYADPTQLTVVECDRVALTNAHTYSGNALVIGAPSTVGSVTAWVSDDGGCSDAGAQLSLTLTCANPELLTITLASSSQGTGSGQASVTWPPGSLPAGAAASRTYKLNTAQIKSILGCNITGNWTLTIATNAAPSATVNGWSLFVEGGGKRDAAGNSGLGMAMHEWTAKFESGKSTSTPDFAGAALALLRVSPADSDPDITRGTNDTCDDPLCTSPFISA